MLAYWQGMVRPSAFRLVELTEDGHKQTGILSAEPFERGFGVTVGNALRRVLLSSLVGTAITSIRIDGILHEFGPIPGVVEDVTELILNLKGVVFKYLSESLTKERMTVSINANEPGAVTAGQIQTTPDLKILNPDHYIATVDTNGSLNIEMTVSIGRGYTTADQNRQDNMELGTIPIDAIFQPVTKVSFKIENTRIEQKTDYERLKMIIETNGGMSPEDAIKFASRILKDHYEIFIDDEEPPEMVEEEEQEETRDEFAELLNKRIEDLELSNRSVNCLLKAGIKKLGQLVLKTEDEVLKTPNFGKKSLQEIRDKLKEYELELGMQFDNIEIEPVEVPTDDELDEEYDLDEEDEEDLDEDEEEDDLKDGDEDEDEKDPSSDDLNENDDDHDTDEEGED